MSDLINRINNFIVKAEKVYLSPGENPPKGVNIQRGKRGGRYYTPVQEKLKVPVIGKGTNIIKLIKFGDEMGVFKPVNGEHSCGSKKKGTLYLREVCAYHIDKVLEFNYVPLTDIIVEKGITGSIQKYVEDANFGRVKECSLKDIEKMALLDLVIGNRDRISANWLIKDGRPVAIDNGNCFPSTDEDKIKSRFVSFLWEKRIPSNLISVLTRKREEIYNVVKKYIGKEEAVKTITRIDYLLKNRKYNYFGKEK